MTALTRSSYLPGLPRDVAESLVVAMKRPEGTFKFSGTYPRLHDPSTEEGILAQVIAGAHVFRLVREGTPSHVTAYHSSPGSGTWTASVDLTALAPAAHVEFWLAWSPASLGLSVVDPKTPDRHVHADGGLSERQLRVGRDKGVYDVGPGVMGATVYSADGKIVGPPALELWRDTLEAVRILLSGQSSEGHVYEAVVSNAVLGMLVTGFETYCSERFSELDGEGVPCDATRVLRRLGSHDEREQLKAGQAPNVIAEASARGDSPVPAIAANINFQSFDDCKAAYNAGFALKFGEHLGVSSQLLERVQRLLRYRHRVVHVSAMLGILNSREMAAEQPEVSNRSFAEGARSTMDEFIQALHAATLRLRPSGSNE